MARTLRQHARRVRVLSALTLVLIVAATIVIELALAKGITASQDGLVQAEDTLSQASELAGSTAGVAERISGLAGSVSNGLGDSAKALDATSSLAGSVNQLIEILATVANKVKPIAADLTATQQTLKDVQTALLNSEAEVRAALPQLQESADTLKALPARLAEAQTNLASSRRAIDPVGNLARIAVGLIGGALAGVVLVVSQSSLLTARARAGDRATI